MRKQPEPELQLRGLQILLEDAQQLQADESWALADAVSEPRHEASARRLAHSVVAPALRMTAPRPRLPRWQQSPEPSELRQARAAVLEPEARG